MLMNREDGKSALWFLQPVRIKFSQTVLKALKEPVPKDVFEGIEALEKLWKEPIPAPVKEVEEGEIRHNTVCSVKDMEMTVSHFLLS